MFQILGPTLTIQRAIILASVLVFGVALAGPADAQSRRPDTRSMTCAQVQSLINKSGAVLLSTGQHTFDRYVANGSYCMAGEFARNDNVPTKDNKRCFARRCVQQSDLFFR